MQNFKAIELTEVQKKRFWSKVNVAGADECWNWKCGLTKRGYARFSFQVGSASKRKQVVQNYLCNRIVWTLENGPIPDGLLVCHKCDNPKCCNLNHYFIGTHKDNIEDREKKGRGNQPKGERHGMAKLTPEKVLKIRQEFLAGGISKRKLAYKNGVCPTTICYVIRGDSWGHLKRETA